MTWFKNCVLIDKSTREANYTADLNVYEIYNPENADEKQEIIKLNNIYKKKYNFFPLYIRRKNCYKCDLETIIDNNSQYFRSIL